jgi:hypothetical protein
MDGCYDSPPYRDKEVVVFVRFRRRFTMLVNLQSEIKFPSSSVVFYFPQMQRSSFVNIHYSTVTTLLEYFSDDLPIFQFHVLLAFALIKN